jgi:hypothetical protein
MSTSSEYDAFRALVARALAVPHQVIKQRSEEHRREMAQKPNRRGPKPKVKTSGEDPADQPDRA